jgi:tetratricopeptide (TPR) repeat protein
MLSSSQSTELKEIEVYKACVALAVSGEKHPEEIHLCEVAKLLLNVRRIINCGDLLIAQQLLLDAENTMKGATAIEAYIYQGDLKFLLATIAHRMGDHFAAAEYMHRASELFQKGNDYHRTLRALINEKICLTNDLISYNFGELYSLQLHANQEKMYDLSGNISRSRACEFIVAGKFNEAVGEAKQAIEYYQLEGYPDDLATSYCILAIALMLSGNIEKAQEVCYKVQFKKAKVNSYWQIIEALTTGKQPILPPSHPLARTPWIKGDTKKNSLTGKLITSLRSGSKTRDELIAEIWGVDALDPSYCNRLYSAITQVRKSKGISILFNGDKYQILE